MASNCTDEWLVGTTDTCGSIVKSNGISLASFEAWNPSVGSNSTGCTVAPNYYVCVGVNRAITINNPVGPTMAPG